MPRFGDFGGISGGFGSDLDSRGPGRDRFGGGSPQGRSQQRGGPARPARPKRPPTAGQRSGGLGDTMPTPAQEPTALTSEEIAEQGFAALRRRGRGRTLLAGRLGDLGEPLIFRPTLGG